MEKLAILYERLTNDRVKCGVCQWRCLINPGKAGVCRMYVNRDGVLYNMNYAEVSSMGADHIEKKPLFHFFPGTHAFSLGSWGCNFHCKGCQNWEISCTDIPRDSRRLLPEQEIELTRQYNCQGVAWTYNEPAMWFEYTLDSARLARENGLYTVYVTNGYATPEALDTIGPFLDAWRVDVKGFTDEFYREIAKIPHWRGILDVARRAKEKWHMRQFADVPATPIRTLEKAYRIGKEAGLKFVYLGNVPGHEYENTACYSCGRTVVRRVGYETQVVGLDGSKCKFCGAELNFRTS
jgi:pyruvate formate lyase activating enzyme